MMHGNFYATGAPKAGLGGIIGCSPWARDIRAKIAAVADCPSNVLITGPTGTGKEVIARAIHMHGPRAGKPFIPVDCAAIAGTLFASHIFGHLKGAFTGAGYAALGAFRAADGGTVFLDEIGELECDVQVKLLRVLQQRVVTPLGSHEEIPVDVRVIAASNRDLACEVSEGRFRGDLYYRLHVISLRTTPLKDRPDDIKTLASHFLNKLAVLHGLAPKRLSGSALDRLRGYDWPGNVRQLENVLERAAFLTGNDVIDEDVVSSWEGEEDSEVADAPLCLDLTRGERPSSPRPAVADGMSPTAYSATAADGHWLTIAELEREHIRQTLERTSCNQSETARLLGIERHQLARKICKYELDASQAKRLRRTAPTL
jgi:DNA-binding NtrC family response regulator